VQMGSSAIGMLEGREHTPAIAAYEALDPRVVIAADWLVAVALERMMLSAVGTYKKDEAKVRMVERWWSTSAS